MTRTSRPRLAPKARLRFDRHDRKWMLLFPERGLALNETGAAILQKCDGERTIEAIATELAGETPRDRVEADVVAFLETLAARGLVTA